MGLEFISSISGFSHSGIEGIVDSIELAPHGIGTGTETGIDLTSKSLRGSSLSLRSGDVILSKLNPGVRNTQSTKYKNIFPVSKIFRVNASLAWTCP